MATIWLSNRIIYPFSLLVEGLVIVGKNYVIRKNRRLKKLANTAMTEMN